VGGYNLRGSKKCVPRRDVCHWVMNLLAQVGAYRRCAALRRDNSLPLEIGPE